MLRNTIFSYTYTTHGKYLFIYRLFVSLQIENYAASLKTFGEKTANLFDKKKKDVEQLATEKAHDAQEYAEDQAKKIGDAIEHTKNEAGGLMAGTGLL